MSILQKEKENNNKLEQNKQSRKQNKQLIVKRMGNNQISSEFKSGKWRKIQKSLNRQILENVQTKMRVQKHTARSDFQTFDDRFQNTQLYNWRKSLDIRVNIVKLYEYKIKQEMFGIQEEQYAYTEIIHRFNNKSRPYSKSQAFLLLMDFLKGMSILFGLFGYFNIDVFLLGVNDEGKGKLWVNQNYAKNEIQQKNEIEDPSQTTQMTLVNNLIRLVSDKVYNEEFMPEISYPWNMKIPQAIEYIKTVRARNVMFQLDKVYADRAQFKHQFDQLYRRYVQMQQIADNQNHNRPMIPQVILTGQHEKYIMENQRGYESTRVKKDPSETLSSDSNSRAKLENINQKIRQQTKNQTQFEHLQPQNFYSAKTHQINPMQVIDKNIIYIQRNIMQPQPPPVIPHNIQQQQIIYQRQSFNRHQIFPQPRLVQVRPHPYEHANHPQFIQRRIQAYVQIINGPQRHQYVERKVIKYRPLNQIEVQNVNLSQAFNKNIQNNNFSNQPYTLRQNVMDQRIIHPPVNQHRPMRQNTNIQNRHLNQQYINQVSSKDMSQSQKLINNVELCESEIFDKNQLLQNLKDLQ